MRAYINDERTELIVLVGPFDNKGKKSFAKLTVDDYHESIEISTKELFAPPAYRLINLEQADSDLLWHGGLSLLMSLLSKLRRHNLTKKLVYTETAKMNFRDSKSTLDLTTDDGVPFFIDEVNRGKFNDVSEIFDTRDDLTIQTVVKAFGLGKKK